MTISRDLIRSTAQTFGRNAKVVKPWETKCIELWLQLRPKPMHLSLLRACAYGIELCINPLPQRITQTVQHHFIHIRSQTDPNPLTTRRHSRRYHRPDDEPFLEHMRRQGVRSGCEKSKYR